MKRKFLNSLATLMLIALSVSVFANIHTSQAAFGTSPPWVRNDHMLPGTTFEQVVHLSRSDTEKAMQVAVRIDGDSELAEWIEIKDEENLIIEKGEVFFPMKVLVNVPEGAENKNYIGGIFVTLAPLADVTLGGGEVAVALGAHISVDISVTGEEITDFEIESVTVESQEQDELFTIDVEVANKGNTKINDIKGQIDVYNSTNTKIIKTLTFVPLDESVASYETKQIEMIFEDFNPEPGEYWVAVTAFKGEEVIYEDRFLKEVKGEEAPITVTPEDTVEKPDTTRPVIQDTVSDGNSMSLIFALTGIVFGLAAIIGLIVVYLLKRRTEDNSFQ